MMPFNFKQHTRALARAAVALPWVTLVACGGGETVSSTSVLQGTVYSGGAAVAGAEVVVMNRLTDQEHDATTDKDGHFSLELLNGHYDIGATDMDRQDATIHGLVTLGGAEAKADIHLPPQDAANDVVSGTIYTTGQTPAAGYRLVLSSNHDDANVHLSATTDDQGRFEFKGIDGQLLFDLDIFDPDGQEVEFIDLHKLDGALHTTIVLGDATDNNVHRHDQAPADGGAAIRVAATGVNQAFNALSGVDDLRWEYIDGALYRHTRFAESEPDGQERIADCWRTERGGGERYCKVKLEGGKLAFLGGDLLVNYANIRNYRDQELNLGSYFPTRKTEELNADGGVYQLPVELKLSGNWFYDYAVVVHTKGLIFSSPVCKFYFTDETQDTYALQLYGMLSMGHTVSYNSKQPDIVKIESVCLLHD